MKKKYPFNIGDLVFHKEEKNVALVIGIYDSHSGEIRLDLSGMTDVDLLEKFCFKKHSKYGLRIPSTVEETGVKIENFTGTTYSSKLFHSGRPIFSARKDYLNIIDAYIALDNDIHRFAATESYRKADWIINELYPNGKPLTDITEVYDCSIIQHNWKNGRSTDKVLFKSAKSDYQSVMKNIYDRVRTQLALPTQLL